MGSELGKIIHFQVLDLPQVSVTHGYNILNHFPIHFHSTYTIGVIEQGQRELRYRGGKTILKPDDVFVIQPFEPHDGKSVNNSPHSYKIISFALTTRCYFPLLLPCQPDLLEKIRAFHTLSEYDRTSVKLTMLNNDIISQLLSFAGDRDYRVVDDDLSSRIYMAMRYITDNCQFDISLKQMAEVACLSEYHFNRCFHKSFGLSPYAYYLVCKLKGMQKVLLSQKPFRETSCDWGFFDQSHFVKLFKKHVGVTPGRYIRDNSC